MTTPISFADSTPRFGLPMLYAGQAQKEVTVNEALLLADFLLDGAVEDELATPPAAPVPGQAWLVASGATGDWLGEDGTLAGWTEGGWRFVAPETGMRVFDKSLAAYRLYTGSWIATAAPALPAGGTVIDNEARQALAGLVAALRAAGVFSAA